ncbi:MULTISPECIES: competence protein CoiA family protein [Facklamia]|uniref:Competence protein CoiA-like family protein n=1 Tax=Facklamia hominis CCUG 36813 TaxID=883111 RepID=K1LP71_9LACT|nr:MULTISPECIES: competence protein CoiA family protein [Facklamia]EKB53927.1 hypothetical protein HMPREF9706_01446 [Facklamia hominis CCUG 36813]OFL64023.1 hypothetical protein HMPREF2758_03895 [Facklamia sp. HMSC062C11]
MYAALSSRGILVYANQATLEGKYYCPDCRQRVQLIQGAGQQAHFRHQSRNKRLAGAESDQHKKAKALLAANASRHGYHYCLEYPLKDLDQIADFLLIKKDLLRVLEFQKSKISSASLAGRHKSYLRLGLEVIWLLDHQAVTGLESQWIRQNLNYQASLGAYFWALDLAAGDLLLYHHLPIIYAKESYACSYQRYSNQVDWQNVLTQPSLNSTQTRFFKKGRKRSSQQAIAQLQANPQARPYIYQLYELGFSLMDLPEWLFSYRWQELYFKEPAWLVLALAWIYLTNESGDFFSLRDYLTQQIARGRLHPRPMPLMTGDLFGLTATVIEALIFSLAKAPTLW